MASEDNSDDLINRLEEQLSASAGVETNSSGYMVDSNYTKRFLRVVGTVLANKKIPYIVSHPGQGKTALLHAIAEREYSHFGVVIPGTMDPTDVIGLPVRDKITNPKNPEDVTFVTNYASPGWVVEANQAEKSLVLFDEMGNADPSIQDAFLTLFQDRRVPFGPRLGDHVDFVAAGNPLESGTNASLARPAFANRLFHINWEPPREDWFTGTLDGWGKPLTTHQINLAALVVQFIRANTDCLDAMPETEDKQAGAWPSRRSWTNFIEVGSDFGLDSQDAVGMTFETARGFIGEPTAVLLNEYLNNIKLPDPEMVLSNPSMVDWNGRADEVYAILNSVLAFGKNSEMMEEVQSTLVHAAQNGAMDSAQAVAGKAVKPFYQQTGRPPVELVKVFRSIFDRQGAKF